MENREWLYELQDIRMGDVFLCIETQSIKNDDLLNVIISYGESLIIRARLLDATGEIGWAICCEPHWEMIHQFSTSKRFKKTKLYWSKNV